MHEISICKSLVDALLDEADRLCGPGARIISAKVIAGTMHQLVPDNMFSAYDALTRGTRAEGSELKIEWKPTVVRCGECGGNSRIDPPFFVCASCGGGKVEIVEGKELCLAGMEVEEESDER